MLIEAAIGMITTTAARRISLTTNTSRWSQRSTRVPAIGPNRRFGSVAATKTKATAIGEPVTTNTIAAIATWWTRSPNSEMSWPAQRAPNEPLRARRTYGWRRSRARTSGVRPGMGKAGAPGAAWAAWVVLV